MRIPAALAAASLCLFGVAHAGSPVTPVDPTNTYKAIIDASGFHMVCDSGCSSGAATPFSPTGNATLAVTGSTGRVALGSADATTIIRNTGSTDFYVKLGTVAVTATTTDTLVPAGQSIVLATGSATYVASITASGTSTLYATTGTGNGVGWGGGGTGGYAQASTTSGQVGSLVQGAATTSPSAYTTATTNPIPLSASGGVWVAPVDTTDVKIQGGSAIGAALTDNPVVGGFLDGSANVQAAVSITATLDSAGAGIGAAGLVALFDETTPPARTENQYSPLRQAANGALLHKAYGTDAESWFYSAPAAGIMSNTTTAVTIKASCGANLKNHLTQIDVFSIGGVIGTATTIAVRDGAGGTVLWRIPVSTAGFVSPVTKTFPMPAVGTAATLLEVVTETADVSGAFIVNAQGYCSR